jgi:hypothetical protein
MREGAVMTIERPMFPPAAPATDPIYCSIIRHRTCAFKLDATWLLRDRFTGTGTNDEQKRQLQILVDAIEQATQLCEHAGVDLINTAPTTLAGIIAAIRYIKIEYRAAGEHMPRGEMLTSNGTECVDWLECFLNTLALADSALDRLEGGKA